MMETDAAGPADRCTNCGASVDVHDWHPLDARVDETGDTTLYTFCSRQCLRRWRSREVVS